nr:AAA family ATPase [Stenotrophomonas sp. Y6]
MILFWADAARVRRALLDDEFEEAASPLQELPEIGRIIQQHCDLLEEQAIQCDQDAAGDQRPLLQAEKSELEARLWISQQAAAIEVELARLKAWKQLDDWKSLANSRKVSIKAGEISEKVITEEYVRRFNNELQELGASRLRVGLVKTRAERGRTLHRLQLIGAKQGSGIDAILSEGERRVVSMAAFLADVADKPEPAPFVFDDPISSLDQTWEETTAARLIRLSQTRQVIVFTHRLSMLSQFSDASTVVYIRQEPWGAGETGEVPLFGKAPEKALNDLRLRRLAQADKLFQTDGADASYPLVKAICSDFRILIERFVETHVLAEVVQRHRREVNTKGKLHNLLKLTRTDCELINGLMTKFSRFEHSQPTEAPVELPGIQELSVDMQKLADWYLEFKARPIPAV